MNSEFLRDHIIPAAYAVLPTKMRAPSATAMLLAIALQESRLYQRRQRRGGPARGYWQFETVGVRGVREHRATAAESESVCIQLDVEARGFTPIHEAIEHNDILACAFARLLLWTYPGRLPARGEPDEGWRQYLETWRPGRPHPETWAEHYARAWALIDGG